MSHFDYLSCLKIRAAWLAEAISERLNVPAPTGRFRYDLYSQLLGYENHSSLVNLFKVNPKRVGMDIYYDLNSNKFQPNDIFKNYFGELNQNDLFEIDNMSLPSLESRYSESWKSRVIKLLSKPDLELRYLRGYHRDIVHYLTETLIEVSGASYYDAIKFQLRIVIIILKQMEKRSLIPPVKVSHIADLLVPNNFMVLRSEFLHGNLGIEHEPNVDGNVPRYFDLMLRVGGGASQTWNMIEPIFNQLTGIDYYQSETIKAPTDFRLQFTNCRVESIKKTLE